MIVRVCLALLLSFLLQTAWAAKPGLLLWISLDVTPAARTGLIEREAAAAGLAFKALDYPLRSTALDAAQTRELMQALRQAQAIWIDAPHASVEARLQTLLAEPLKQSGQAARPLWITAGQPAADDRSLRAYLQAGGVANTRAAFALLAGRPAAALAAPALLPQRGLYLPGAPALFANAQDLARWSEAKGDKRPAVALLLHRYHFVHGATAWIDDWLGRFERQGMLAYAVFSSHLAGDSLAPLMEDRPGAAAHG